MLEEKIVSLTEAILQLDTTIKTWMASGTEEEEPEPEPEPAPKKATATKSAAKAKKPVLTTEMVREKLREVSIDVGAANAKVILAKMKVKKVDELTTAQMTQVMELCEEALAEANDAAEEEDDI